jgi:prevent-host-death family protein
MKFANIRDLQKDASGLVSLVEKGEDVIITKRGKPVAVMYPLTEETMEDYMISHSPSIKKKLAEGMKDAREGNVISLDDMLKRRNLKRAKKT